MIRVQDVRQMKDDGSERFLIDRQWPKGVVRAIPHKEKTGGTKRDLAVIKWRPQLGPSIALWQWYQLNPDKADRFRARYFKELREKKVRWLPIVQGAAKNDIVLLYQAKHLPNTPAHFFKEFLDIQAGRVQERAHVELPGRSERGLSIPAGKVMSRKSARPLNKEMRFEIDQKLKFFPAKKRIL